MHRYEELEKLYYKKKILKFVFVVILIAILAVAYIFLAKKDKIKQKKEEKNITKPKIEKKIEKKEIKKQIKKEVKKDLNKTTKPKKEEQLTFILPKIDQKKVEEVVEKTPKVVPKKTKEKKEVKPKVEIKPKPVIIEKQVSLKELINKFNQNPSYDLALLISKEYYKKSDLKNAKLWVIKANNLKPEDVESWILFANILLKQNKKSEALNVLKIYIETYGSNPIIEKKIRSINE